MGISISAAGLGWFCWPGCFTAAARNCPRALPPAWAGFIDAVANKYYIDELYAVLFVKPLIDGSTTILWHGIDEGAIDATVNNSAGAARHVSDNVRHMQSGNHALLCRLGGRGRGCRDRLHGLDGSAMNHAKASVPSFLSLVTFLPAGGRAADSAIPRRDRDISCLPSLSRCWRLLASLHLPVHLHRSYGGFQFEIDKVWIATPTFTTTWVSTAFRVWLVVLTTFLTPLCVLISWNSIHERVKEFFILLLMLETALIGVFIALDLFLFYFFWEATLIPMALLIGMYGHGAASTPR